MEIVRLDLKRALLFLQKPVVCVVHPVCVHSLKFTVSSCAVCCLQKCEHYADNEIEPGVCTCVDLFQDRNRV